MTHVFYASVLLMKIAHISSLLATSAKGFGITLGFLGMLNATRIHMTWLLLLGGILVILSSLRWCLLLLGTSGLNGMGKSLEMRDLPSFLGGGISYMIFLY